MYKEKFINSHIKYGIWLYIIMTSMIVWKIILINKNHIIQIQIRRPWISISNFQATNGKLSNVSVETYHQEKICLKFYSGGNELAAFIKLVTQKSLPLTSQVELIVWSYSKHLGFLSTCCWINLMTSDLSVCWKTVAALLAREGENFRIKYTQTSLIFSQFDIVPVILSF